MANSSAWMYTILPISAISGGLGVLLPLYILASHGSVYNVAIAIALFELVSIPASLFWGDLTDRLGKIKFFILVSIIGLFPILLIFYLIAFVPAIEGIYGLYAFIATASSPAINLLIMSHKKNPALPRYFSRYSILSISGSIIGTIPGLFLGAGFIKDYLMLLLVFNVVSLGLTMLLVRPDKAKAIEPTYKKSANRSFAVLNMLSYTPYILTGYRLIEKIRAGLSNKKIRNIYILLASIGLFDVGLYLFNTSYIPYLSAHSISFSNIFLVSILNGVAQLGVYAAVISFIRKINLGTSYLASNIIRVGGYLLAVIPALAIPIYFLAFNMVGYAVAGVGYAIWNMASSVILYTQIRDLGRGHYIGVWVAILGASAVVGAFLSGVLSSDFGYIATFSAAIMAVIASLLVFTYVKYPQDRPGAPST